jgi:hypothetical protein
MPINNIYSSNTFSQFRQAFNEAADIINSVVPSFVGGSAIVTANNVIANNVTANNLTAGRIAIVGTSGIIQDDAGLTYNPTTDVLTLSGTTETTNSATGTLVVSGGVGISKNLYVSGIYLNNQNVLRFGSSANANYVGLRSNSAVGSNVIWTLPNLDGLANQALITNGSGGFSFANTISTGKSIAMAIIFGS